MALSGIAVVTGGAGFIGSHIAGALASSGVRVRVLDDLSTGHRENLDEIGGDIDFVRGSVADEQLLSKALENVELIFHEAAIPSVPRSVESPRNTHIASVDGTFSLLLAAKEAGVRRRVYGLETVSLRYFNVFGPRQDPGSQYSGVVSRFISALLSDERPVIFGDGEQSRDFTYIENVVAANLSAASAPKAAGNVINVANGERITLNELLNELKQLTGRTEVTAEYRDSRVGDVRHSLADITMARELLGYESKVDLREGLKRTLDWWKTSRFATR